MQYDGNTDMYIFHDGTQVAAMLLEKAENGLDLLYILAIREHQKKLSHLSA